MDRCALFVDAGYALADGAMAVHGTRRRDSVSWDHAGLLKLLAGLARDRTGLPVLRCYWYETAAEGRRTAEHDALAEMPGLKLRLVNTRPGRREGIENQLRRDLVTLAKNGAISDAFIASADEHLAEIVAEVQDLGVRVVVLHIASDGGWTIPQPLRQECDDIVEISGVHLRPFVDLVRGAEPVTADEQFLGAGFGSRGLADNGSAMAGALTHQGLPAAALPAPGAVYPLPDGADYRSGAQPYGSAGVGQPNPSSVYSAANGLPQLGEQPGQIAQAQHQSAAHASAGQGGMAQRSASPAQSAHGSSDHGSLASSSSSGVSAGAPQSGASVQDVYPVGTLHNGSAPQQGVSQSPYQAGSAQNGAMQRSSAQGSNQQGSNQQGSNQQGSGQQASGQQDGALVAYHVGSSQDATPDQSGAYQNGTVHSGGVHDGLMASGYQNGGIQPNTGQNGEAAGGYQSTQNNAAAGGYQNGAASASYQNGAASGSYQNGAASAAYQHGPGQNDPGQNRPGQNGAASASYQNAGAQNNGQGSGVSGSYQSAPSHNGMTSGSYQNAGGQHAGQNGGAGSGYQNGSGHNSGAANYPNSVVAGSYQNAGAQNAGAQNTGQAGVGQAGAGASPNGASALYNAASAVQNGSPTASYQNGPGQNGPGQNGPGQNGPGQNGSLLSAGHDGAASGAYHASLAQSGAQFRDQRGSVIPIAAVPVAAPTGFEAAPTPSQQQVYGAPDQRYFQGQPGAAGTDQPARAAYMQDGAQGAGAVYQAQYAMQSQPVAQAPMARVPQPLAIALPDAVKAAHAEGFAFGESVGRDAPGLWLEAVLARKPRMPSDLEARLLQGSVLPIDSLLHDEVRHSLRRGFWDALESARR